MEETMDHTRAHSNETRSSELSSAIEHEPYLRIPLNWLAAMLQLCVRA